MPVAPTPPKLPKYFPDLQGENRGLTPHAGWYQNEFIPWIQSQEPKKIIGYGIGMFLLAGTAILLGLGIHKYQDQIQELTSQVTQPIKDALGPYLGPYLGALGAYLASGKDNVLVFLGEIKEKVMNLPSIFSSDYLGNTEPESGE